MYQELEEDDEFYTLQFGSKKKRRRRRRRRVGENKENEGVSTIRGSKSKGDSRIALGVLMNCKNGCEKDEIGVSQRSEVLNCSENSSPDSVLEFPPDLPADACKGDNCRVGNLKMRRTLSDELESCRNRADDDEEEKMKMKKKKDMQRSENSLIRRTGKLAMATMEIEMGMGKRRRWEEEEDEEINVKEVGRDVASYILDHLLDEFLTMLD